MGYSAISFSAGEQPTTAKWNILGSNDSSFNDGTGIADSAILPKHLLTGTGSTYAWASWTPTWTNLTIGNGTNASKYIQIGKNVYFVLSFTFGSTSSMGSAPNFTLPVTSVSYPANTYLGMTGLTDSSAGGLFPGPLLWLSTTTSQLQCLNVTGASVVNASVGGTNPFGAVFATGDSINGEGFYQAA